MLHVNCLLRNRSFILAVSIMVDRSFYKSWTLPPFKFLHFNIAQSLAVFYGRNDWHYYLSQAYPLLLTTFLPFGLAGLYKAFRRKPNPSADDISSTILYQLATVSVFVPFILSFVSHKEVRFIYPLLPSLHVLAASSAASCFQSPSTPTISSPFPLSYYRPSVLPLLLLSNILISLFTTQYHQRAVLSVTHYLRHQHEVHYLTQPPSSSHLALADTSMTVGFLMPCHSTPWRSHLVHTGIKAWALGCEPPVHIPQGPLRGAYRDEADRFYDNPAGFLQLEMGSPPPLGGSHRRRVGGLWGTGWKRPQEGLGIHDHNPRLSTDLSRSSAEFVGASGADTTCWDGKEGCRKLWPDYLVFFEGLETVLRDMTGGAGYGPCWRGWNGWFHDDWRRRGDVVVWCLRGGSDASGGAGQKALGKEKGKGAVRVA